MMGVPQDIEKTPYQTVQQVDNDVSPIEPVPHKKRTPWEKLGTYNVWVLILGTIVVMGAVGFLAFLWTVSIQQGSSSTKNPFGYFNTYKPRLWILILKEDWTSRAVTLTTVLVRVALAAQLAVFAAIMAALILERVGASAQDLPLLSMIRCANTGPQALLWNVMHTLTNRSQLGFSVTIVIAILNALALQFMSTILLADFDSQLVVLDSRNTNISWAVNNTANFVHTEGADYWRSSQTFYPSFAEHKEGASHGPNFVDTGMTYRGFLPFANQSKRESLKWYRGPMTVVNERVICVKPKLSEFLYELPDHWDDTISAKIDYNRTHPDVVQLPTYSNSTINCTMPYRDAEDPGYLHTSICRLGYGNGQMRRGMLPETDQRSLNETNVWLMFKVSGPVGTNWTGLDGPNVTVRRFPLRQVDSPEGPWAKLTAPNITIDVTSCVLNPEPEVYTVEAESASGTTLTDTSLAWVTRTSRYDTDSPRWRFGVLSEAEISMFEEANEGRWTVEQLTSNMHRGIMSLKAPPNWPAVRTEQMTSTPYRRVIHGALEKNMHWAYALSGNTNDSFVLTPKAGKFDAIHRKSMWLAQDILNQTNNPAFVLQTLSHIVLQTAYYDWYDSYDLVSGAIVATEERRSIPSTYNHILAVGALLLLHFVLIGQALFLFLTKTEMSLLGNAWQAVAQVSSNDTAVAVHHGTMSTDDEVLHVAKTSGFAHHRVVLKRSDRNGRLEATALRGG